VIAGRSDKTPMSVHRKHWFLTLISLLLPSLPYLMPIVRSLDLLNGMESEEVGLPIPYICQRAGGALLMLWRTDLSCF
jgi:hypothetical protein